MLTVGNAPELLEGLEDLKVVAPEAIEFFCDVDLGSPKATITWFKNDKPLTPGEKYDIYYEEKNESAILSVIDTTLEDAGVYKVVVANDLGQVTSEGTLTVHTKPTISPDSSSKVSSTQKVGSVYTCTVNITGYPTPTVTWLHNDVALSGALVNVDTTDNFSCLKWKDLTMESAGTLVATASNEAGSASATFNLQIIDKPSPPENLEVKSVTKDSVDVCWSAPLSNGGSEITSYIVERMDVKRGNWVSVGTVRPDVTEFTVAKLTCGNEYLIRVFAENEVNSSEPAVLVNSVVPKSPFSEPGPPQNLACKDITPSSCTVVWAKPLSDGNSPITGYTVERKSQYNTRWTKINKAPVQDLELEIGDLVEGTDYEFRVFAENEAGASVPSKAIGPITAQEPKGNQSHEQRF